MLAIFFSIACGAPEPSTRQGTEQIPTHNYGPETSIDALDFAIDGDGFVHLVWSTGLNEAHPKPGIWYQRGDLKRKRWGTAIQLADVSSQPRIIVTGNALHLFFGWHLRHFESIDSGTSWKEETPAIDPDSLGASAFDAVAAGGRLVLAYATRGPQAHGEPGLAPVSVWVSTTNGAGWTRAVRLPTPSVPTAQTIPAPRLMTWGDGLYLLYGVNEESRSNRPTASGSVLELRHIGRLLLSRSDNGGTSWGAPVDVGRGWTDRFPRRAEEFAAVTLKDRLLVAISTPILLGTSMDSDGVWSEMTEIAPFRGAEGNMAWSPTAAAVDSLGQLVWIDDRWRNRDSNLNPLNDHPDWADNDVLAAPLSGLMRSASVDSRLAPVRLTSDLQFAQQVCARSWNGKIYVIWTGRARVGKGIRSGGSPPCFFMAILAPK